MLPSRYDQKLSIVVENLRKARGIKQLLLANVLCISESEYSKKATGLRPFTCSQLRMIGKQIGVSHLHILAIADACFDPTYSITPLSHALADLFNALEKGEVKLSWPKDKIISTLRGLINNSED